MIFRLATPGALPRSLHPPGRPASSAPTPEVCPLPDPTLRPSEWVARHLAFTPDPRQAELLDLDAPRLVLCAGRQVGKSTTIAAKAVHSALAHPGSAYLVFGPVRAQAGELLDKIRDFLAALDIPVRGDGNNARSLRLPNGARFVALPDVPRSVRGFSSIRAVIIDEAAFVDDRIYAAVSPMLAASAGRLWVISTPNGQTNKFHDLCTRPQPSWTRFFYPVTDCPRISAEFLQSERELHGEALFAQEYLCAFIAADAQFLDRNRILAAAEPPAALGTPLPYRSELFLGVDVGKRQDHTAIVVTELSWSQGERNLVDYSHPLFPRLTVRYAESLPLGSSHLNLPRHLAALIARINGQFPGFEPSRTLAIDATGESTLVEVLRRANLVNKTGTFRPVTITNGYTTTLLKDSYQGIPRPDLLTRLRTVFEQGTIHLPRSAPGIEDLERELINFRTDGRQREHDDLVFALALSVWYAIQQRKALLSP